MIDRQLFAQCRTGRRLLAVLITLVMLIALAGSLALAQGETPRRLNFGDTVTGSLSADGFAQVYTFNGQAGSNISVVATSTTEGLNLALLLTNAAGEILGQQASPTQAEVALRDVTLAADGAYYITVLRSTGAEGEASGTFSLSLTGSVETSTVTLNQGLAVTLRWSTVDDMDLEVRDPVGNAIFFRNPTAPNGGALSGNANNGCTNTTRSPSETISWPRGEVPSGSYEIIVYFNQACVQPAVPLDFTVTVTVDGRAQDPIQGRLNLDEQYVASFVLTAPDQVTVQQGGANPLLLNLTPFAQQIASPVDLGDRTSIQGRIDRNNQVDVWSFEARVGDVVSIGMDAILGGSLDPQLILLDSRGNVIASNDDATPDTRNALIANQQLPADDRYLILATRFGKHIGGTEGNYVLTISGTGREAAVGTQPTLVPQPGVQPTPAPAISTAGLPAGSIEISLVWNNRADVRLLVRDPENRSLFSDNTQLAGGGVLAQQDNLNCRNVTASPLTYAYWPLDRLSPGTYEVQIWLNNPCDEPTLPSYTLVVSVRGQEIIRHQDRPDPNRNLYVTNFTVNSDGSASVGQGGIFAQQAGVDLGDIAPRVAAAQPLVYGRPVNGIIDASNTYDVYTFQARAGDRVRISMRSIRGTLDPFLYLLDSSLVQLERNDDVVPGRDPNSRIDYVIPADGGYVIVATRFGANFGGTSGGYELSIAPLTQ